MEETTFAIRCERTLITEADFCVIQIGNRCPCYRHFNVCTGNRRRIVHVHLMWRPNDLHILRKFETQTRSFI